ncbi:protein-tyrosine phosphatase-like protein [Dichotomocladium elegans]|nr:protein-tyrosine phosphatase-like protein [Dichotomocladium elegans]
MDVDPASHAPVENLFTSKLAGPRSNSYMHSSRSKVATRPDSSSVTPTIVDNDRSDDPIALSVNEDLQQQEQLFDIPADILLQITQSDSLESHIYSISAEQYIAIHHRYVRTRLPDDILFPWLHGVDGKSDRQNIFFRTVQNNRIGGSSCSAIAATTIAPRHRGIMLVHADEAYPLHSRLVDSVLPSEIISEDGPVFIDVSDPSINLRNFKIQVVRYASISDIVVYGRNADIWAHKIAHAQAQLRKERMELADRMNMKDALELNDLEYRVLMIRDPFTVFEQNYRDYVGYDSNGVCVNEINFWKQEKEEIWEMSKATLITPHIWVGNTQDAPASNTCPIDDTYDLDENPNKFSICIEAHDLADMPLPSTLTLARESLNELPPGALPADIIHLDVYSTFTPPSLAAFDTFYDRLIHLLMFLDDQSSRGRNILIHCSDGYSETSLITLTWIMYKRKVQLPEAYLYLQERRSFFVYAADVVALRRIEYYILSGPRAIRGGNLKRKREDGDLRQDGDNYDGGNYDGDHSPAEQLRSPMARKGWDSVIEEKRFTIKDLEIGSGALVKLPMEEDEEDEDEDEEDDYEDEESNYYQPRISAKSEIIANPSSRGNRQLHHDAYINTISNDLQHRGLGHSSEDYNVSNTMNVETAIPGKPIDSTNGNSGHDIPAENDEIWANSLQGPLVPTVLAGEYNAYPWFYSTRFEGSFPSRILPFLYLGNLNHATNPEMLKVLRITHVVSVGEHADLDRSQFKLLFLDNLYDDGIDSIRARMDEVLRFVDDAHTNGENCLIHCRVGVSRSAAITICYVMYHLKMTLVQAYLFVRARRLNVIIQPNLKFMYEMLQLEQDLYGRMMIAWPTLCSAIHRLNMTYRES